MVNPQIPNRGSHRLQVGHINVEIHAVDRLVLKHHMIAQHIRHGSCYPHRGLRSSTGPRTHRALRSHTQGMSLQARPGSTQINPQSPLSSTHAVPIYLVGLRQSLARPYAVKDSHLLSFRQLSWRTQLRVTNGIVLEVLIGSLEPPINGLARRSTECARLVPDSDTGRPRRAIATTVFAEPH